MQLPRPRHAVAALGALLLIPLVALPAPAQADGVVTVTHEEKARWPSGFQTEVTISNGTAAPVEDWTIDFALPDGAKVHQMWNAALADRKSVV